MPERLRVALTSGDFDGSRTLLARPRGGDGGDVWLGRVVPGADADIAVFPFNVPTAVRTEDDRRRLVALVRENARAGLRTVTVVSHDHVRPVDLGQPDAVVLRTSMIGSMPYSGEHAMPVFVNDPWPDGTATVREWRARPTVGFMGRAAAAGDPDGSLVPGARRSGFVPIAPGVPTTPRVFSVPIDIGGPLRVRALAGLAASSRVEPSLVVRERFYGHYDEDERARMRVEYAEHLRASDYVLCVRGYGNFSIRLFETMAMGRVPVLLETDLVLPCADVVDWDAFVIRVPLVNIDRVDEYVAAAHAEGRGSFAHRQAAARAAYLRWLRVDAFAHYVASHVLSGRSRD